VRRLIGTIGIIACGIAAALVGSGTANATISVAAADCTGTAQIVSLGFTQSTAQPGQTVTAQLVAQNCTTSAQQLSVMWYARLLGDSSQGPPPGCVVFDPLILPLNLPASGQGSSNFGLQLFNGCTASTLEVSATLRAPDGSTIAQRTADLPITQNGGSSGSCTASFTVLSQWTGGFVAVLTVTNTGNSTINGWVVKFTFTDGERIANAWNATVTQSGAQVTAKNMTYNASLPPGGSVSFGIQGTGSSAVTPPTGISLNGSPCSLV
jgi:cellulase/cellobiase CelA1